MDREKYVDESWKESVELEKKTFSQPQSAGQAKESPVAGKFQHEEPPVAEPEEAEDPYAKHEDSQAHADQSQVPFLNYITSLGFQAMIFLGEIPHPATNQIEKNVEQAKFLIDTLVMLREKTKGNLNKQEADILNTSVYELQLKYVETIEKEAQKKA